MQGQAESYLEKLHNIIETELNKYKPKDQNFADKTVQDWTDFRTKIVGLTELTRTHFNKLVEVSPFAFAYHARHYLLHLPSMKLDVIGLRCIASLPIIQETNLQSEKYIFSKEWKLWITSEQVL